MNTTATVGVSVIIGLLVGAGIVYAVVPRTSAGSTSTSTITTTVSGTGGASLGTVTIGALLDLTGGQADYGALSKTAANMALNDVNSWLAGQGSSTRFQLNIEDEATDPATALTDLQNMAAQGIQVYVGVMTTGIATNLLPYATSHHLVLISSASTGTSINNRTLGYLYRIVPPDSVEGVPFASALLQSGYTHAIVLERNDPFGTGLVASFEAPYAAGGGSVDVVPFTPLTTGTYDFTSQLGQMQNDLSAATAKYGQNHVAVFAVGFDEIGVALSQASGFPSLLKVPWFTNQVSSTNLLANSGANAKTVNLSGFQPAPAVSSKYTSFLNAFQSATGQTPGIFSGDAAYDAVWLAALSILACGQNNGVCIQASFPTVADNYFGVTGWTQLNANGDRTATNYGMFGVATVNGTLSWVSTGYWDSTSNSIVSTGS